MSARTVAEAFDEISKVYDDTRDPLDAETLERFASALRTAEIGRLLEVGVGTGRVAAPLAARGFRLTGVDASRGMLARARGKGLDRLVRGNALRLPFRDDAVDATLFVHVLHIFDDPVRALAEGVRVGRQGAFALVHPPGTGARGPGRGSEMRGILREVLAEEGYVLPEWPTPAVRERDLLQRLPPDSVVIVSDREITESLAARLDRLAKRGHRNLLRVPPEALRRAVAIARERVGDRTVTYRSVEALATWSSDRWDARGAEAAPA